MVDAGWQIARTLPSENRQRRRTLGIADMCGAGFRRIRPSGSTCGVVVRKKEDRVPLDRLFAEYRLEIDSQTLWDQLNVLARHLEPVYDAEALVQPAHPG